MGGGIMNRDEVASEVVKRIRQNKHKGEFSSSTVQNLGCYEVFSIMRIIDEIGQEYLKLQAEVDL
jgi:hypothetical protein